MRAVSVSQGATADTMGRETVRYSLVVEITMNIETHNTSKLKISPGTRHLSPDPEVVDETVLCMRLRASS